ncbi:MAG: Flp pilus assembly protein CpaB [Deltaproteobacteria bacterium]|nr:Flp pilus assembly protein CpaB [Deltaproteobacteria bacterium]
MDDLKLGGRPRRDAETRRFGARAFVFWVLALAAGGAAAYLIHSYVKDNVTMGAPVVTKVALAAVDLELATTLQLEHVRMVDWPESVPAPNAVHNANDAVGRVLTAKAVKGQILLETMFAPRDSGKGLAALIPPTMRAVAVRVDDVVGVAGFIHPEDRVDVIVTIRPTKPDNAEPTSKVILQNVEVLTVGKEIETKDNTRNKPIPVTVATLLVTPENSEKLALAANQGKILLTLRSRADDRVAATSGVVPSMLLAPEGGRPAFAEGYGSRRTRSVPSVAASPAAEIKPPDKQVVEILRGDRFEQRKFEVKEAQ